MSNRHRSRLAVAGVALGVVGCVSDQSGGLAANGYGDLSQPAVHGSPLDEIQNACGPGTMTTAGAVVLREPYLQQVTSTSAMVGWVTAAPTDDRVDITEMSGALMDSAYGDVERGTERSTTESQMWATLGGLVPDTIHCYTLADGRGLLAGKTGFRTAPTADSTKPVRFMAFGDSGSGNDDQRALRDQMFDLPYELIIHTGDLAYDSGTISQFNATVFDVYKTLFRSLPFFPAAGNHEYETMQGAPFREVFALPGDGQEKWYSYDWGKVHFVALDTEASYTAQARWLDQDLAASSLPWKIVYMHRPPYSSGTHGSDLQLRAALAPVLEKHHVQLVLAGHDHNYERMIPQNGVAYVVTGGGGKGPRDVGASSFTAFSDAVIHFVYVEVGTDELVLHAIDATGFEFDSMVVPRVQP